MFLLGDDYYLREKRPCLNVVVTNDGIRPISLDNFKVLLGDDKEIPELRSNYGGTTFPIKLDDGNQAHIQWDGKSLIDLLGANEPKSKKLILRIVDTAGEEFDFKIPKAIIEQLINLVRKM